MNWTYKTYQNKYKKLKRDKDFLEIECSDKDSTIRKQEKIIKKLERENYEYICLLMESIKGI